MALAALTTAAGVLWTKIGRPLLDGLAVLALARVEAATMLPLLRRLVDVFEDPTAFDVLHEIAQQVRNDSGSSLLDTVQRIDRAAASIQERALFDREQVAAQTRYIELMANRINDVIDDVAVVTASAHRQEGGAAIIAADLAASHARSDAVTSGEPGAAADAGAQS